MNNKGISLQLIVRFSLIFARNYRSLSKTENCLTSHRSTVTDLKHHYYIKIFTAKRNGIELLPWRPEFNSQQVNFFSFHYLGIRPSFSKNKRGFTELMLKVLVKVFR